MTKQTTAVQTAQPQSAKLFFQAPAVKAKFEELLGKRSSAFITSVLQIVSQNTMLANADPSSIFNAAATAATLDLPLNNNLGFAYIVPYNARQKDGSFKQLAQFQLGYKGFIQLAQRSGQFTKLSAAPIYEGQILTANPLTGYEFDFTIPASGQPIGYAAYFKLTNGFDSTLYMSASEIKSHGLKYSKTFAKGVWQTDFDGMAKKTVLKLLLSRYAPLSIEMQTAIVTDQAVINDADASSVTYIDNEPEAEVDKLAERLLLMIEDASSVDELMNLEAEVKALNNEAVSAAYSQKGGQF